MPAAHALDDTVLALWERAAARPPLERDDALLAAGGEPPPRSLSQRHAALLQLRSHLFGPRLELRCPCPSCGETAEFDVDCDAMAAALRPPADAGPAWLQHQGWHVQFRVPDADDLRALAGPSTAPTDDADAGARALLQRCLLGGEDPQGRPVTAGALPASLAEALSQRMEALEPGASIAFDVACPACGGAWSAPMDVGQVLWSELQQHAERVLLDVDQLARAYGWNEAEVLALSPVRRAAYLQLAALSP